jgi:hypothetical protein
VTSTHHQRQYPFLKEGLEWDLLGWCEAGFSPYSQGESPEDRLDLAAFNEVEAAVYHNIRALAIQSHPEFVFPATEDWAEKYIKTCRRWLNDHMEREY